eukprot:15465206-Alexandrium_andersonii.AAC.1
MCIRDSPCGPRWRDGGSGVGRLRGLCAGGGPRPRAVDVALHAGHGGRPAGWRAPSRPATVPAYTPLRA